MNEFLAWSQKGCTMDLYYEEFVKLSCYAPLMTEEQKLSRFILGLGDELVDKVDTLQPANLENALIRSKAKLGSKTKSRTSAIKQLVKNYYGSKNGNVQPHLSGST